MTTMLTDYRTALEGFVRERTEAAFRTLVEGHIDWLYSVAKRMVRDATLAEDVTQAAFLLLWQYPEKARGKRLGPWLYRVVQYCAANVIRGEARRAKYERRAAVMRSEEVLEKEAPAEGIDSLVEGIVGKLKERDREIVLLRFYQNKSHGEIGTELGITEEAARKRVSAAVERLRHMMTGRGMTTPATAAALAATLSERMTSAAPVALKAKIIAGGAGVSGSVMGLAEGARNMMWMMKVKLGLAVVAVVVLVGGGGWMAWQQMAVAGTGVPVAAVTVPSGSAAATELTVASVDLSAPDKTMAEFVAGLKAGDRDRTYRALLADPKADTPMNAAVNWNLAANRMVAAAREKFGPQVSGSTFGMMTIDMVAEMMLNGVGPDSLKQDAKGDTAELSIQVPPEILGMFTGGARQMVQMWSGAPMRFKKVGGEWKLDLERTMRVQGAGTSPEDGVQNGVTFLKLETGVMDGLATDIRAGKMETLAELRREVRSRVRQAMMERGVEDGRMSLVPADYKGP